MTDIKKVVLDFVGRVEYTKYVNERLASDFCFHLANKISDMSTWVQTNESEPTDTDGMYWVKFEDGTVQMCYLNDYKKWGGHNNYWQDLGHDDHPMENTEYMFIKKPE